MEIKKEKTETEERFKNELEIFHNRLKSSKLIFRDGIDLLDLASNLFLRYEEIRISREKWKKKYIQEKIKNTKFVKGRE